MALCDPLAGGGSTRVFGRGDNPINFVSVREVAKVAERAVVDPALRGETIEVTGPEDLSMNELLQRSRTDTTAPGKVAHVPRSGLRVASFALRPINPCRAALIRAALVMDTWDMTAPPPPARARAIVRFGAQKGELTGRDHPVPPRSCVPGGAVERPSGHEMSRGG